MLDRLELVLTQIVTLERQRDAVLDEAAPGDAERMIQQLVRLRGIGVQSATLLVREAFVRPFANGKALGAYAGLSPTPYSSGGTEREQGIGRAGNARLRTVLVELAWIWQRYQPGSAIVGWFRDRLGGAARRLRKVMVVALARKLLIALWRFATQGVVPEGAALEPAGLPPWEWRVEIRASCGCTHGDPLHAGARLNRGAVADARVQALAIVELHDTRPTVPHLPPR